MKQHVLSVVLLKRWARRGRLRPVHLRHGPLHLKAPKRVAFIENLTGDTAAADELEWQRTENVMPSVFKALEDSTLLDDPEAVATMHDFLGPHFARSNTTRDGWLEATGRARLELSPKIRNERAYDLDGMFIDMTGGLHPAGPEAREMVVERMTEGAVAGLQSPDEIADRIAENLQNWMARAPILGFEIAVFDRDVLVIGDRPVIPWAKDGRFGFLGSRSVPFNEADAIFFPLGPRHLLSLTSGQSYFVEGTEALKRSANGLQIAASGERFFAHPSTDLGEELQLLGRLRGDI